MKPFYYKLTTLITLVAAPFLMPNSFASEPAYEIMEYKPGDKVAQADLSAIAWLEGKWKWEADIFGPKYGQVTIEKEEHSQMAALAMGYAREGVFFNEIMLFREVDGGVEWRLKHFTTELHGWEAQNAPVVRHLLKATDTELYFDDFTYVKQGDDKHMLYGRIHDEQGTPVIIEVPHFRVK